MTKSERFKLAHSQARAARAAVDPLSDLHRRYDGAVPAAELRRVADEANGGAAKANRIAARNSVISRQSAEACRAVGRALRLYGPRSDWFSRAQANQAWAWSAFKQQAA